MTGAIQPDVETAGCFTEQEISAFSFDIRQSTSLHKFAEALAAIGGPQAPGTKSIASLAATELKSSFSKYQCELLSAYSDGLVSALSFEGLQKITDASPPNRLPALSSLENRHDVLCLAARNQILLELVDNSAFAYDMDNEGKLVRLVANFKGGGLVKINAEPEIKELSSHSGLALGPHTEALTQESALVINNVRALHCRDVMKDNRRVLVRIFGLSKFSSAIVISEDPLQLQG
jgi:hypothetical protein